jgi:hypothetical protein
LFLSKAGVETKKMQTRKKERKESPSDQNSTSVRALFFLNYILAMCPALYL